MKHFSVSLWKDSRLDSIQISPIIFKIDFNPNGLDINELVSGKYVEFLNFVALDDLKLTLDAIKLSGVRLLYVIF